MNFNSIDDIEKRLNKLQNFPLKQIARNVGIAHFNAMRGNELRIAILAIANGELSPLPYNQRQIMQPTLMFNQDIVDAVLTFSEANLNK